MSVPTFDQFIEPILRHLATYPDGVPAHEAHEAAADALGLSAEQRQELIGSGQTTYKNRAGWAHDRLKRSGLSSSPRHGRWKITDEGLQYVAEHLERLPVTEVERLATANLTLRLSASDVPSRSVTQPISQPTIPPGSPIASPDDRLEQALKELHDSVAADLLESLRRVSPAYFEVIVLDLLHRLGYGASRDDLQRVGGSGDGGIDGVIALDKLGLDKVYVQAKRWQNTVGRPELQAFYGALAGQKSKRGVFITTSGFTAQALDFAGSVEGIVLIDGAKLVHLMIECEVGVSSQILKLPKLDSDYFDEEGG